MLSFMGQGQLGKLGKLTTFVRKEFRKTQLFARLANLQFNIKHKNFTWCCYSFQCMSSSVYLIIIIIWWQGACLWTLTFYKVSTRNMIYSFTHINQNGGNLSLCAGIIILFCLLCYLCLSTNKYNVYGESKHRSIYMQQIWNR